MKKIILTFLIIFFYINVLYSQQKKEYSNNKNYEVLKLSLNDTLVSRTDSIFYMNSNTFNLYNNLYNNIKSSKNTQDLINTINVMKSNYEQRIKQQDLEYNALKKEYTKVYKNSVELNVKLNGSLDEIGFNSKVTKDSINEINKELKELNKKNKRKVILEKVEIAVGGILVGAFTYALLK
jgi:hypothetical protein